MLAAPANTDVTAIADSANLDTRVYEAHPDIDARSDIEDFDLEEFDSDDLDHLNDLEARDDTTVDCNPIRLFRSPKGGFRTVIDSIPNTRYSLNDAPYGFGASIGGNLVCMALRRQCSTCGTIASEGENIRRMLHKGYRECVKNGRNDASGGRFWQYRVSNPSYQILARGGPCPGNFRVPGEAVYLPAPH